jgi:hypothetical protein
VEIASKELLDSDRVEEGKEECEVLVDFEKVPASLAWFPGRFQRAWKSLWRV